MNGTLEGLCGWLVQQYDSLGIQVSMDVDSYSQCHLRPIDELRVELFDRQMGVWVRFSSLSAPQTTNDAITQDVRWALDAVSGLEIRSGINQERVDELGAWQVHVIWLVPNTCKAEWERSIRELRSRSAHPEEIGLDLVDLGDKKIEKVLATEGIPSLLFKSRKLMNLSAQEMPRWVSPDTDFERELRASPSAIVNKEQREFFERFMEQALGRENFSPAENAPPQFRLGRLAIKNFRNIVDAEIPLLDSPGSTIIHGPNGSGKSSLFEAISLAMTGSSDRLVRALEDSDLLPKIKATYAASILTRFGLGPGEKLVLRCDDQDVLPQISIDKTQAAEQIRDARGTLLAQEDARRFVQMSANDAAALVLGNYSPLARRIQRQVDEGFQKARVEWQEWLRSVGLNAAITKRETILKRIIERALAQHFPSNPIGAFAWMDGVAARFPVLLSDGTRLRNEWADLDSQGGRELIAEQISKAIEKSQDAEPTLLEWMRRRNSTLISILNLCDSWETILRPIREEWPRIKEELTSLANWLRRSADLIGRPQAEHVRHDDHSSKEAELEARLAHLAPQGQLLRLQRDQIQNIANTFLAQWNDVHPHDCPICNAHHERSISEVIAAVGKDTDERYASLRMEYAEIQSRLKDLRATASEVGECPLSKARIEDLSKLLHLDSSGPNSLEGILSTEPDALSTFSTQLERIFVTPSFATPLSDDEMAALAREVVSSIISVDVEGAQKQEMPVLWSTSKKTVDSIALRVIDAHLPSTVGALWSELSLALAPSRWNQSATPKMAVESSRGSERLSVVVSNSSSDIPARHILNQAEQHVLGLAWFFTSFLLHGRFRANAIVLDDPAHEMDQVTYRKFVRFLQAFLRMHTALSRSLNIIVFLHQEERALDLARATTLDGTLTVLEWSGQIQSRGPDATVKQLRLRNDSQRAPLPPGLRRNEVVSPS